MEARQSQKIIRPDETGDDSPGKGGQGSQNLRMTMEEYEKEVLLDALAKHQGNKAKTATMLGIDRKTLYTKLKKYGML